ncbi:MAG TPA: hypothetical protein VKH41_00425 [Myxococcota bacterium]|nr:hypothetical protein [Myxococcota bacterium]
MRNAARALAAAWLLTAAGCATTAALDRRWIEVHSANFSIYTALDEASARQMLEDRELFRAAILAVTKVRRVVPHVPTEIYAFVSNYEPFRPGSNIAGYFHPTLRTNLVAIDARPGKQRILARAILYREYTHFLLHNEGRAAYPLWFDEGFAQMLSSVDVLGAMVRIGVVPAHRVDRVRHAPKLPYSRILHAQSFTGWSQAEIGSFYAQAWLLVHNLTLGQLGNFGDLLDRYLAEVGRGIDEDVAFHSAFGIDVDDLRSRLLAYQKEIPSFGLPRGELAKGLAIEVRAAR